MKPIHVGDVMGDYRVIDIAGSGGMGAVYKIEHVITRRIEAMKLLPPGSSDDPDQVQRFEREIQVQARLHHPNIVALYNAVRDGSSIALVMEFVEGESLQRMLEAGPLPVATAVELASQVLRALAYAHEAGVIHRDVAPANIIVTPDSVAKLSDFGLARGATDLRLSTSGAPLGSPWYMSPEQVRGIGALDARTDLYSMGAVLHEMLTGGKLFDVDGAFAVMRAHVEMEPALPSARNPLVPAALDEIVRKAVAKDPAMRFQSADEFLLALQALGADVGVEAASSLETLAAALPRPVPRVRELPRLRIAMLAALVPAALIAGLVTVKFFQWPARVHAREGTPRSAAAPNQAAVPPAPAIVVPVVPLTTEAPTIAPPTAPSTPLAVPAETQKPAVIARPRTPTPVKASRRDSKSEPSYAIRVTGGDSAPAVPAASPASSRPVDESEATAPKTDSVEAPKAEVPQATPVAASELGATPQDAAGAKPQNTGNRFVRALGKVNPFRKAAKHDAGDPAKTPLKKD